RMRIVSFTNARNQSVATPHSGHLSPEPRKSYPQTVHNPLRLLRPTPHFADPIIPAHAAAGTAVNQASIPCRMMTERKRTRGIDPTRGNANPFARYASTPHRSNVQSLSVHANIVGIPPPFS